MTPQWGDVMSMGNAILSISYLNGMAMIRSGWIIEWGSDTPRLTTCYPL